MIHFRIFIKRKCAQEVHHSVTEHSINEAANFEKLGNLRCHLLIALITEVVRDKLGNVELQVITDWICKVRIDPALLKFLDSLRSVCVQSKNVVNYILVSTLFVNPPSEPFDNFLLLSLDSTSAGT